MTDTYVFVFLALLVVVVIAMAGVIWLARVAGRAAMNPPSLRTIRRMAWLGVAIGTGETIFFGFANLVRGETNWLQPAGARTRTARGDPSDTRPDGGLAA